MKKKNNAAKIENITDLTKPELAFIAEDLLCEVLDRAAYNNEEYNQGTVENTQDYIVTYYNNTNVGTGTVKIEGTGRFKGTVTKEFQIQENNLVFREC